MFGFCFFLFLVARLIFSAYSYLIVFLYSPVLLFQNFLRYVSMLINLCFNVIYYNMLLSTNNVYLKTEVLNTVLNNHILTFVRISMCVFYS